MLVQRLNFIKKGVLLCFILVQCFCFSQNQSELDSLGRLLQNHPEKDSVRAGLLLKKAYQLVYPETDKSLDLAAEALEIALKLNLEIGKYKSYLITGMAQYKKKAFSESLQSIYKALTIADALNNEVFQSMAYANLGNIYADIGNFDDAMANYNKYLAVAKSQGNPVAMMEALTNIGILQTEYSEEVIHGIENLKKALAIAEQENLVYQKSNITLNLGLAYKRHGDLKNALANYEKAIALGKQTNDKYIQLLAITNIGTLNIENKNWNKAEINSNQALKLAEEIGDVEWAANAWDMLYTIYEQRNNHAKALQAYKNFIKLNDSLKAINNKDEIIKIEEKYKFEKEKLMLETQHEKELLVSEQTVLRQKLMQKVSFVVAVLILVLMVGGFMFFKRKRENQFNLKVAHTELKALRAQMNPHFIFNSLNSIGKYINSNDADTANNYLTKFSKLMRQTLEHSEKDEIPIEEDVDLLIEYMDIEKKRISGGFHYNIEVAPDIDVENTLVPPMVMQPFVENSIWHGISNMEGQGHIQIEIKKEGGMLLCSVDDNGVGRAKSSEKMNGFNKVSLGTKITKNRIDIINKRKNAQASLKIIDKAQGTRVEIKLPLQTQYTDD